MMDEWDLEISLGLPSMPSTIAQEFHPMLSRVRLREVGTRAAWRLSALSMLVTGRVVAIRGKAETLA